MTRAVVLLVSGYLLSYRRRQRKKIAAGGDARTRESAATSGRTRSTRPGLEPGPVAHTWGPPLPLETAVVLGSPPDQKENGR